MSCVRLATIVVLVSMRLSRSDLKSRHFCSGAGFSFQVSGHKLGEHFRKFNTCSSSRRHPKSLPGRRRKAFVRDSSPPLPFCRSGSPRRAREDAHVKTPAREGHAPTPCPLMPMLAGEPLPLPHLDLIRKVREGRPPGSAPWLPIGRLERLNYCHDDDVMLLLHFMESN